MALGQRLDPVGLTVEHLQLKQTTILVVLLAPSIFKRPFRTAYFAELLCDRREARVLREESLSELVNILELVLFRIYLVSPLLVLLNQVLGGNAASGLVKDLLGCFRNPFE